MDEHSMFKFNKKLQRLGQEFQRRERQLERTQKILPHQFLVIRLDGIGFTRRFLKKRWEAPLLERILSEVIEGVYRHLYNKHQSDHENWFVGMARLNDEISFIFSPGPNRFHQRMYKILSTVNGLASAYATHALMRYHAELNHDTKDCIAAFDARPLLLQNAIEVERYLWCRYGFARYHTTQKLLNLTFGDHGVRSQLDLDFNLSHITELNLLPLLDKMESQFVWCMPDNRGVLQEHKITASWFEGELKTLLTQRLSEKATLT